MNEYSRYKDIFCLFIFIAYIVGFVCCVTKYFGNIQNLFWYLTSSTLYLIAGIPAVLILMHIKFEHKIGDWHFLLAIPVQICTLAIFYRGTHSGLLDFPLDGNGSMYPLKDALFYAGMMICTNLGLFYGLFWILERTKKIEK